MYVWEPACGEDPARHLEPTPASAGSLLLSVASTERRLRSSVPCESMLARRLARMKAELLDELSLHEGLLMTLARPAAVSIACSRPIPNGQIRGR